MLERAESILEKGKAMARRSRGTIGEFFSSLPLVQIVIVLGVISLVLENLDAIIPLVLIILGTLAALLGGFWYLRQNHQQANNARLQQPLSVQMEKHEAALIAYFRQSIRRGAFGNVGDHKWLKHIAALIGRFWFPRQHLQHHLSTQMEKHETALVSYFRRSISRDDFGNVDDRKWLKYIDVFLETQVMPNVTDYRAWRASHMGHEAAAMVDRFTRQRDEAKKQINPLMATKAHRISPDEYERLCADILENVGWTAQVTQSSRDHGADVIAEKSGVRVIIQCKRYAQPVGNKAVQEAHSALHLYAGHIACVVAPSGFTSQAQREAHGLGVKLLHHSALDDLDSMIGIKPSDRLAAIKQRVLEQ